MSTVFGVPCPACGQQMVRSDGEVECTTCDRRYRVRMGHLFPSEQPTGRIPLTAPPATAGLS